MTHTRILPILLILAGLLTFSGVRADGDTEPREGGLTGTGIAGTITELGSIVVNGQRIAFDDAMDVSSPLGQARATELQPGDAVAVAVEPAGQGWRALDIVQVFQIVGPVMSRSDTELTVMGTRVTNLTHSGSLAIGDWVAVSGLWSADEIVATRVVQVTPQRTAHVQGSYSEPGEDDILRIGGTVLQGLTLEHARSGDVIRATGRPDGLVLRVEDAYLGLFDRPVDIVLVEGYLSGVAPNGHYTVLGTGLTSFTSEPEMAQERVEVCGYRGRVLKDTLTPEAHDEQLLRQLGCF